MTGGFKWGAVLKNIATSFVETPITASSDGSHHRKVSPGYVASKEEAIGGRLAESTGEGDAGSNREENQGSWWSLIGENIKKAIAPPERNVGVESKHYFDPKAGRWRFEGEEDTVAEATQQQPMPAIVCRPPPLCSAVPGAPVGYAGNPLVGKKATASSGVRSRYVDVFGAAPKAPSTPSNDGSSRSG